MARSASQQHSAVELHRTAKSLRIAHAPRGCVERLTSPFTSAHRQGTSRGRPCARLRPRPTAARRLARLARRAGRRFRRAAMAPASRFSARPERRLTPPLPLRLPQGRFTPSRRAVVVDKQHSVVMLIPKKNRKEVYKYLFRGASPGDPRRAPRSAFLATVAHPAHPVSPRALTPPRVPSVAHRGCHLREEGLQPPRAPRDQGGAQPSGTRRAVPRVRRRDATRKQTLNPPRSVYEVSATNGSRRATNGSPRMALRDVHPDRSTTNRE